MKLTEIADRLSCTVEGEGNPDITGVAGLEEASPGDLSFLSNPRYYAKAQGTRAAAVIVGVEEKLPGKLLLRSENPYLTFAQALDLFAPAVRPSAGIHPLASIAPGARIGRNASIGPYVVVEDGATIGDDCVLKSFVMVYRGATVGHRFFAHSHAVVRENARIGNDCVLQNGAVVGCDGFGFAKRADGSYQKIAPAGAVVLEDGVEVQAHTCIDRASVGETRVRRGAKLDNLVQVGHGCDVGEDALVCAQVGLAGSSKVGARVTLAGQAGVAGHLTIGAGAIVTAQSGVPSDIEPGRIVSGSPTMDHMRWLKCVALLPKLPEIYAALRKQGWL